MRGRPGGTLVGVQAILIDFDFSFERDPERKPVAPPSQPGRGVAGQVVADFFRSVLGNPAAGGRNREPGWFHGGKILSV